MKEFDRIIGYAGIKQELEQTADILRNLDAYKAAGAKTPSGMLIHGAPGVGKSLMAECLIAAAGVPAFTARKDKVNGAFVDFIKHVFDEAARSAPSIVYLDDMDKFANTDEHHRNAEEYVAVQSCIDAVKDRDVFVLATTNELECLPDSLYRAGRFDKRVNVHRPDGGESAEIIRHYLSGKRLADDLDWEDVVMLMFDCTCAELESTLNEALLISISRREEAVSKASFMEAFFKTRVQMPFDIRARVSNGGERGQMTEASAAERRKIAVHEAGHAAIYEILAGRAVSLATAFRKEDQRGGICYCYKPVECANRFWDEVHVLGGLGGRAAIDLVYGMADEGAGDDLHRVAALLRRRIESGVEFGMPFMPSGRMPDCESEKWRKEALVEAEVARLFQKAKEVLAANREFLDKLADAIAENEYLISSDIQAIKETCEIHPVAA